MVDQERLARAAIGAVTVSFPENKDGAKKPATAAKTLLIPTLSH
jgi:hypothetical protein